MRAIAGMARSYRAPLVGGGERSDTHAAARPGNDGYRGAPRHPTFEVP